MMEAQRQRAAILAGESVFANMPRRANLPQENEKGRTDSYGLLINP